MEEVILTLHFPTFTDSLLRYTVSSKYAVLEKLIIFFIIIFLKSTRC
jgi:hypothetical protein